MILPRMVKKNCRESQEGAMIRGRFIKLRLFSWASYKSVSPGWFFARG
jgi:hypothetical protein